MRATLYSDTSLVIVIAAIIGLYGLASVAIANMRAQRLAPLCAAHGWMLVDNNMGGPAKCLDPKTGLMYLPLEVLNQR